MSYEKIRNFATVTNNLIIIMIELNILLFFGLGGQEILLIALIILLLFGGTKIPELMRGLGKGVKNFKDGMKDIDEDIKKDEK